jgi:hypothetical protein
MAKKDIGKILTTGSPKQRMLIIAEDIARGRYFKDRILTDHEFNQLSDSFKKPNEIKIWNKFRRAEDVVANALINLQGGLFEVKMNYSNLRGYILVWNSIENTELLVNSILHEIKDPEERKRIAKSGAKGIDLLFSKTEPDKEGYLEIKVDFEKDSYKDESGKFIGYKDEPRKTREYSLWYVMNNVKIEATTSAIKWLSWEKALQDYIEEQGFNIKTYKDKIQEMRDEVYTPIIGWAKYYGELNIGVEVNPKLYELLEKYAICPNIEELEINIEEYNFFKNVIIGDE